MIVRNEEANLLACLSSAADLVDEIIVVDTGSTDDTRDVAARFGAKVFDFPWVDNFAAARNESLGHANGHWIFWLDADDRLDEINRGRLRRLFADLKENNDAYLMQCVCPSRAIGGSSTFLYLARLFPNHPQIRWQYRIHEQILPAVQHCGGAMKWTDITIQHLGYQDASLLRRKQDRNLRLALLDNIDYPDDPFVLHNLGKTYLDMDRPAEAAAYVLRSLNRCPSNNSILPNLHELLTRSLRMLGKKREALAACRAGLVSFPNRAGLLFLEGRLLCDLSDFVGAETCFLKLLQIQPEKQLVGTEDPGIRGYLARHNLAMLYFKLGRFVEAEKHWHATVAEKPDYALAWLGLGDLWLQQGRLDELEKAAARLEADPQRSIEKSLLQGRLLLARGAFTSARKLLEHISIAAPHAVGPRILLSHVLIQEGQDWLAAETVLEEILSLESGNLQAQENLTLVRGHLQDNRSDPTSFHSTPTMASPTVTYGGSTKQRVSLCMIIKNESSSIPKCLSTVIDLVDEAIVVDTGSTDNSQQIAAQFGAQVYDFKWVDDFSAARNEGMRHASGQWIFWLDADEWLDTPNRAQLQCLFAGLGNDVTAYVMRQLCLKQASLEDEGSVNDRVVEQVRLFPNHPQIRWQHRVFEQILPSVRQLGGEFRETKITIQHGGYQDPALYRSKIARNLRLAELENQEQPNDPYNLYVLGMFHQMLGRPDESVKFLQRSLQYVQSSASFGAKLHALLAQGQHRLGHKNDALVVCRQGRARYPNDAELLCQEGMLLQELGDIAGAERCWHGVVQGHLASAVAIDPEVQRWARHGLARLYRRQGKLIEAVAQWETELVEHPEFALAWLELGELCISLGDWGKLEEIVKQIDTTLNRQEDAAVLQARGLMMRKEYMAARILLEQAIQKSPRSLRPRQALSHMLLFEGRDWTAAEQALRDILVLNPGDADAQRNLSLLLKRQRRPTNVAKGDIHPHKASQP